MSAALETRPCGACGQILTRRASRRPATYWYCNHACQARHRPIRRQAETDPAVYRPVKETQPCGHCGAPVTAYRSVRHYNASWSCSRRCAGYLRVTARKAAGRWTPPPRRPRTSDTVICQGCGASFTRRAREIREGRKYCSRGCWTRSPECQAALGRRGSGQAHVDMSNGYVRMRRADGRWVLEHRDVMEQALGRPLLHTEQVHHRNGIRHDNRAENLEVLSQAEHARVSLERRQAKARQDRAELAEYRRRYGPLPEEV